MKTTNKFEKDFYIDPKTIFVLPKPKNKPIKIIFEGDVETTIDNYDIQIKRKLSSVEVEKLLIDIFGVTNIGIFNCGDMTDEEINKIIDN